MSTNEKEVNEIINKFKEQDLENYLMYKEEAGLTDLEIYQLLISSLEPLYDLAS